MKNKTKYREKEKLIVEFLYGRLTENERKEFNLWLNKSTENQKLFEQYKKLWEHSLKLSSIESINLNKDWQLVKQRINFTKNTANSSFSIKRINALLWKIAASVIVLIGIGILAKQYLNSSAEMIFVQTGDLKKEIVLPDGSTVFLNKNAELIYPEKFRKSERLVSLRGEGYFKVAKNEAKKFLINIDNQAVVEVLGTSFNINSEKENGVVNVYVLSGKVAFYLPEKENSKTILIKNENAVLQDGRISKNLPKNKNFLSWQTGILFFENEKIENVCNVLSQFYDKTIITEGFENKEIRFTSTIDNQKLVQVLEELKLVLNLEYTLSEEKIVIHPVY